MKSLMEEASSIIKAIEQGWKRAGEPATFSVKVLEHAEKNFFGMTTKSAKIAFLFEEPVATTTKAHQRPQQQQQPSRPAEAKSRESHVEQPRHSKDVLTSRPVQEKNHTKENTREQSQPRQQQQRSEARPQQARQEPAVKDVRTREMQPKPQRAESYEAFLNANKNQHKPTDAILADDETGLDAAPKQTLWTQDMVAEAETWIKKNIEFLGLTGSTFSTDAHRYYLKFKFDNPVLENPDQERLLFSSFAHLLMQTLRQKYKKPLRGLKVVLNRA